jgi:hypothetical protein
MFTLEDELRLPHTFKVPVHPTLPLNRHSPSPGLDNTSDAESEDGGLNDTGVAESEDGGLDNTGSDTQGEDLDANLEEHRRSLTPSEFIPLPEQSQVEPVKVLFPGRQAGEVVLEGIPTMKEYENNLGGATPSPYAPFNSEIDWELAKWA